MRFIVLLLCYCVAANAAAPPCTTPLNPALETICFSTVSSAGNFSIREYASGVNVSLVTSNVAVYAGDWALQSESATSEMLYYFEGSNSADAKVPLTVPLIYRPQANTNLLASMAIPTSDFPNPTYAPRPSYFSILEPFPAIRIAALTFETPALATDIQYSFACGELQEILTLQGVAPVAGPWGQAWVTYSARAATPHINECWMQVPAV